MRRRRVFLVGCPALLSAVAVMLGFVLATGASSAHTGARTVSTGSALLVSETRSASQPQGLIAFKRSDGIYLMQPNGSHVRPLKKGRGSPVGHALDLAWSPDGHRLAFAAEDTIWVIDADGRNLVSFVLAGATAAGSPTWSPDGRKIAYTAYRDGDRDIWVMNADGSEQRRLKRTPKLWDSNVDWKPTGGWLAFDSGGYAPYVYVMRTDGSGLHKVAPQRVSGNGDEQPDWSPDGRRIVYVNYDHEIWVMNANGQSPTGLTSPVGEAHPVWSPDGSKIAFSCRGLTCNATGIYVMDADGTSERRLTAGANPAWQPVSAR